MQENNKKEKKKRKVPMNAAFQINSRALSAQVQPKSLIYRVYGIASRTGNEELTRNRVASKQLDFRQSLNRSIYTWSFV